MCIYLKTTSWVIYPSRHIYWAWPTKNNTIIMSSRSNQFAYLYLIFPGSDYLHRWKRTALKLFSVHLNPDRIRISFQRVHHSERASKQTQQLPRFQRQNWIKPVNRILQSLPYVSRHESNKNIDFKNTKIKTRKMNKIP